MLDCVIYEGVLRGSLDPYVSDKNKRQLKNHLSFFFRILKSSPFLRAQTEELLSSGVSALQSNDYWLKLEVEAQCLNHKDDVVFRRCLMTFIRAINDQVHRPSEVIMEFGDLFCLNLYRKHEYILGNDITKAIYEWEHTSQLSPCRRKSVAKSALQCLRKIMDASHDLSISLCSGGLITFSNAAEYNLIFKTLEINDPNKILQSALLAILGAFNPNNFKKHEILLLNEKKGDVTDLYYLSPVCVKQLVLLSSSPRVLGEKGHSKESMIRRFKTILSILTVFFIENRQNITACNLGLDAFKGNEYALLKISKETMSNFRFNELVLLLEDYWGHSIQKYYYLPNLLPFYFPKLEKYRVLYCSDLAEKSPRLFHEVSLLHESETRLLAEKNYDIESLYTHFTKLKRILINFVIPKYSKESDSLGLECLSANDNRIQKSIFQQIQSDVKSKKIALRTGESYFRAIRWVMNITGQEIVDAFRLSSKRYQYHAKRLKVEDLYTDEQLRELVFYVEKGLDISTDNKQKVALYFARIQLKTCWSISPLTDIEVSDISEIELPTAKKAISVLTQKPRKKYNIDCYQLDGRSVRSVMHDILYIRDTLTKNFRNSGNKIVKKYLFIYQERKKVKRLDPSSIVSYIDYLLKKWGCSINYNSLRIRKSGANYTYQEVAKDLRAYEANIRHDYSTFIRHYQRINEVTTQQTLHGAVDVMQKYFTGREIDPKIKILMGDDDSLQKTPTGECASVGNDKESKQYSKEHKQLHKKYDNQSTWCGDYLACIWCKHFRTVADAEHVWQLLSYRDYVLEDMSASVSNIDSNLSQVEAINALHGRVNAILDQLGIKNKLAVINGRKLLEKNGIHPFWTFAITGINTKGDK